MRPPAAWSLCFSWTWKPSTTATSSIPATLVAWAGVAASSRVRLPVGVATAPVAVAAAATAARSTPFSAWTS
ncbi:hypothetical protein [Actinokineospora sp. UTMC 2448]|uniref:hypothetical protein n=1 Tax=Actinokineospora sp. UTMC 2448 TaxID=2268449 RepID=UPI002164233B|nr:hypothetical protein [Actinokineospora sp. UTMC 2448]